MGGLMDKLMIEALGYPRYVAAGGDWGGHTAEWMGLDYPAHVQSVHTSIISLRPEAALRGSGNTNGLDTEAVCRFVAEEKTGYTKKFGYAFQQGTRPQALAFGMMDSPVGAAAWMLDKFYDWSDLRARSFEQAVTLEELLTEIMIYQRPARSIRPPGSMRAPRARTISCAPASVSARQWPWRGSPTRSLPSHRESSWNRRTTSFSGAISRLAVTSRFTRVPTTTWPTFNSSADCFGTAVTDRGSRLDGEMLGSSPARCSARSPGYPSRAKMRRRGLRVGVGRLLQSSSTKGQNRDDEIRFRD
jgi:hypothetical protein